VGAAAHEKAAESAKVAPLRDAHHAVAEAHHAVAEAHQAHAEEPKAPDLSTLPHDSTWRTEEHEVTAGAAAAQAHIKEKLGSMSAEEKKGCYLFSRGHDYEMRALERGVSREDLLTQRRAKFGDDESHEESVAHIARSAEALPHFHTAQEKLATTSPPPPSLYRGMGASDKTLGRLLSQDEFSCAGMSSSSSLNPGTAEFFGRFSVGQRDYQGDEIKHEVVFKIDHARSAPIMDRELTCAKSQHEQVLHRDARFRITKRTVERYEDDGPRQRVIIHMSQIHE